ncbi:hypothetical protein KKA85_04840 [bacterium]|nr:hypothetical protein [bacterium]MBU1675089.1 hypothetical protein [bacterium]
MTNTRWRLVCLVLLASAWGLSELIGGETIRLTVVALLLLAAARALVNRPGSSTAMAAIAVLFKSVNAPPFFCHLMGIALLSVAFDLAATLLWRDDRGAFLRAALTGAISAYLSSFLFATSMVWIFKYKDWAEGGLERIGEYTLYPGSPSAFAALIVVPVGLWLGCLLARQAAGHPRTALATAVTACLALWVLGPFAG